MVKILWISRHEPLPAQEQELKEIFGEVEIIRYKFTVRDVDHVLALKKALKADELVCVLPLSILRQLCERGVHPLMAVMEAIHICENDPCPQFDPNTDWIDPGSKRHYRFQKFERLLKIEIVTEPINPLQDLEDEYRHAVMEDELGREGK